MGLDITGLGALGDVAAKLVDKFFPDKTQAQKDAAALEMATLLQESNLMLAQTSINLEEAKSTSLFIAGWRPAIGWTCGFALAYAAVFEPLLRFSGTVLLGYSGAYPVIDTNITLQVLLGLLGLAGMRSAEKIKGAEGRR